MVNYLPARLDTVFAALADPTRRAVVERLAAGRAPVGELARGAPMSLPGFMKHLRVLEDAGLIACSKAGRVVSCELSAAPMQEAAVWLSRYRKFWSERLDALARYLYHQEELNPWPKTSSRKSLRSPSPAATPSRRRKSGGRGQTRKR